MDKCEVCGNTYEKLFEIRMPGDSRVHLFDSFECASYALAPRCSHCGVRVMGHGVEFGDQMFCGAHCARKSGVKGVVDNAFTQNEASH